MEVKLLQDCIFDKIGKSGRENLIAQNNLVDVYTLPFNKDNVNSLFEFADDLIWDNFKNDTQKRRYTMEFQKEEPLYLPPPKTIGEFIHDNVRYWRLPMYWDANLVRRLFKFSYE